MNLVKLHPLGRGQLAFWVLRVGLPVKDLCWLLLGLVVVDWSYVFLLVQWKNWMQWMLFLLHWQSLHWARWASKHL